MTSANALHYIYGASGDDTNRKLALLAGRRLAAAVPRADQAAARRSRSTRSSRSRPTARATRRSAEIFATVNQNRGKAAAEGAGLPRRGRLARPVLRRRPPHDLPQGPRQPRLQVRRRGLGGMPARRPTPKWRAPWPPPRCSTSPAPRPPDSPLMNRAREAVSNTLAVRRLSRHPRCNHDNAVERRPTACVGSSFSTCALSLRSATRIRDQGLVGRDGHAVAGLVLGVAVVAEDVVTCTSWRPSSSSSRCQRSTFMTGLSRPCLPCAASPGPSTWASTRGCPCRRTGCRSPARPGSGA